MKNLEGFEASLLNVSWQESQVFWGTAFNIHLGQQHTYGCLKFSYMVTELNSANKLTVRKWILVLKTICNIVKVIPENIQRSHCGFWSKELWGTSSQFHTLSIIHTAYIYMTSDHCNMVNSYKHRISLLLFDFKLMIQFVDSCPCAIH